MKNEKKKQSILFTEKSLKIVQKFMDETGMNFSQATNSLLALAKKMIDQEERIDKEVEQMTKNRKFQELVAEAAARYSTNKESTDLAQ
jgi:hypothetical protein